MIYHRINNQINSAQVRVIDEKGKQLGVMPLAEALYLAQGKNLDLIEVATQAKPPVCRLADFDKLRYKEAKKIRKQKAHQKAGEIKGIRLSFRIAPHDQQVKLKQAIKFLGKGYKLRPEIRLRGREKSRFDLARQQLESFVHSIDKITPIKIEQPMKTFPQGLSMIIARKQSPLKI